MYSRSRLQPHYQRPYWIPPNAPPHDFPPVQRALANPPGLLAIGGDLSPARLLQGYQRGIFPWYSDGQPILWWAPDRRMVLFPARLNVTRSMRKVIRNKGFSVTFNRAFAHVINYCAHTPRPFQEGSWITAAMCAAYVRLHELGYAHSVECWYEGKLVGGLYGVALGKIFYGESMFSHVSNASKVAFVTLVAHVQRLDYQLIDAQFYTSHLESLGAEEIARNDFMHFLAQWGIAPEITPQPQALSPYPSN
jgi:leucyl/phenylalanyl-tRNA---protein transferase